MAICLCCMPGEDAHKPATLIETQSVVDDDISRLRDTDKVRLPRADLPGPVEGASFVVGVDSAPDGTPLGLTFDFMDAGACIVANVSKGSLIDAWNSKCTPNEMVCARDRLLQVNGTGAAASEVVAQKLAAALHKDRAHALLKFQHPVVSKVSIKKGAGTLGLNLHYAAENPLGGLCVKSIAEGVVKANSLNIKEGDRIMDVNGQDLDTSTMLQKIRDLEEGCPCSTAERRLSLRQHTSPNELG
ncbi:unnamed protein product [Symbiodinium sp. CCMP2592]|nr:unnamed protein product [Symbiodinium sp. CCMP2592]